jgi:hypothetical protein
MKLYLPSNATEGDLFMRKFCEKCYKYSNCSILFNSLIGKQSKKWVYDESENPKCLSFQSERPKSKPKENPNQVTIF